MRYVGHYADEDLSVKRGHTVTIKKGVTVWSTHPRQKVRVCGHTYKVKVDHVLPGCTDDGVPVTNPTVTWVGAAGYWCWVDINEVPEANSEPASAGEG